MIITQHGTGGASCISGQPYLPLLSTQPLWVSTWNTSCVFPSWNIYHWSSFCLEHSFNDFSASLHFASSSILVDPKLNSPLLCLSWSWPVSLPIFPVCINDMPSPGTHRKNSTCEIVKTSGRIHCFHGALVHAVSTAGKRDKPGEFICLFPPPDHRLLGGRQYNVFPAHTSSFLQHDSHQINSF